MAFDLRRLLIEGNVSTQDEICHQLETQGHIVNQSKISRMLRKLDAVKSKNEHGQIVYRLSKEPAPPTKSTPLYEMVIDITSNEMAIIIQTSPGSAPVIARLLDYQQEKNHLLGTIAGDDTILVLPKSIHMIKETIEQIEEMLLDF